MKKTIRAFLAALCASAMILLLTLPLAGAANDNSDIIFIAVNERVLPLDSATMPVERGGVIYGPYSIFDTSYNVVGLGLTIAAQFYRDRVTIFNKSGSLSFYYKTGEIINNSTGETMSATTFYHNGTPYVPLVFTAQFFGLDTHRESTDYGLVLRIKSADVVLSDKLFMDVAPYTFERYLDKYRAANASPSPSPTASESPSPSPSASPSPSPSVSPSPEPTPVVDHSGVRLLFAFRCSEGGEAGELLPILERRGLFALFLFTPEEIRACPDTVRQIVSAGHSIGLVIEDGDIESMEAALEEGNRALEHAALTRTRIACPESAAAAQELTAADWICWRTTLDGRRSGQNTASSIVRILEEKKSYAHILLDDSAASAAVFSQLLTTVVRDGYALTNAVETRLQ